MNLVLNLILKIILFFCFLSRRISGLINLQEICNINIESRMRLGTENITQQECLINSHDRHVCFDPSYGCYKNKYDIPGFTNKIGNYANFDIQITADISINDPESCALLCLKLPNCLSFTVSNIQYGLNQYCYPKTASFRNYVNLTGTLTFDRHAFSDVNCISGGCHSVDSQHVINSEMVKQCKQTCKSARDCNYFSMKAGICMLHKHCSKNKQAITSILCNAYYITTLLEYQYSKDELEYVNDKNSATCINLYETPLVLRYPFPGVNKDLSAIKLSIIGENFDCELTETQNMFVFVPKNPEFDVKFIGKHKTCDLTEYSTNKCSFSCDCNGRYCESVYIFTFSVSRKLSICEIDFL